MLTQFRSFPNANGYAINNPKNPLRFGKHPVEGYKQSLLRQLATVQSLQMPGQPDKSMPPGPNSALRMPLFDANQLNEKFLAILKKFKELPVAQQKKMLSQFHSVNHPALYRPILEGYHQRTPNLNREIKIYYSALDTEIAEPTQIQRLSERKQAEAANRLIAKRLIDAKTGKSYAISGKGNPTLQSQSLGMRLLRGEAGTATMDKYSGKYIQNLYEDLTKGIAPNKHPKRPTTIYMIRPGRSPKAEDCTVNFLSEAAQCQITVDLNDLARRRGQTNLIRFVDDKNLYVVSRTARSNASPIGRLVQQGYYDTSEIKRGDRVVIVDDHSQSGSTILSMSAAVQEAGGKVLAAIMPTVHPYSRSLGMHPAVRQELLNVLKGWDAQGLVQQKLADYGMPVSTLTNHEAMIVIAYAIDPMNATAVQRFHQLESMLNGGAKVLEGESDSLQPVLAKKPASPAEVAKMMDVDNINSRKVIKHVPVKSVHVLDNDDFLIDEKKMNYKLFHNALAALKHEARKRTGKEYRFIEHLATKMREQRGQYQAGMPELCMTGPQFSETNIPKNETYLKKDMILDMLSHLQALDPQLAQEYEELAAVSQRTPAAAVLQAKWNQILNRINRGSVSSQAILPNNRQSLVSGEKPLTGQEMVQNILWHEFSRQKERMLNPREQEKWSYPDLPFPDVKPELRPGAKTLLDSLRRPDNYVILRTNSLQRHTDKMFNLLNMHHYFDAVIGHPEQLTKENGQLTLKPERFKKPNAHLLEEEFSHLYNLDSMESFHFWGDTKKDHTQVFSLIRKGFIPASKVHLHMVNPGIGIRKDFLATIKNNMRVMPQLQDLPQVTTAKNLVDKPRELFYEPKL